MWYKDWKYSDIGLHNGMLNESGLKFQKDYLK